MNIVKLQRTIYAIIGALIISVFCILVMKYEKPVMVNTQEADTLFIQTDSLNINIEDHGIND